MSISRWALVLFQIIERRYYIACDIILNRLHDGEAQCIYLRQHYGNFALHHNRQRQGQDLREIARGAHCSAKEDRLEAMNLLRQAVLILGLIVLSSSCYAAGPITGRVVDSSGRPIAGAIVTADGGTEMTDENGAFSTMLKGEQTLAVRAYGYRRSDQIAVSPSAGKIPQIRLSPVTPKGLYLTGFGIGNKALRDAALKLIEETELNTLVIDVKGDGGMVTFKSSVALAFSPDSQKVITVKDMKGLMKSLREKDIYTIARIVVFKDNPLVTVRPDLAVRTQDGTIWHDREGLAWVDPFRKEVWDYNIGLAIEAAQYGFDEIQFDYVRFPDTPGLKFSEPNTEKNRVSSISGFLADARKKLAPFNVFVDADIFGYVCWNLNDSKIGQRLADLAGEVDYLSPMLYPSGFQFGIPGYLNPVDHPYEIVYLSLQKAKERIHLPPVRFRPWLQAFRDYAFDRRYFGTQEIKEQISAAEKFGSNGWMLWNPHNIYSKGGLQAKSPRP
jgi:hypothetical protein